MKFSAHKDYTIWWDVIRYISYLNLIQKWLLFDNDYIKIYNIISIKFWLYYIIILNIIFIQKGSRSDYYAIVIQ